MLKGSLMTSILTQIENSICDNAIVKYLFLGLKLIIVNHVVYLRQGIAQPFRQFCIFSALNFNRLKIMRRRKFTSK
jgi:hypothetical protein